MEKLILDYSKWRCGGESGDNVVGKGPTALLNEQGYLCCLGQFTLQLNSKITNADLLGNGEPGEIDTDIIPLNYWTEGEYEDGDNIYYNTRLSTSAMYINDNRVTTPEEKIEELKELFAKSNYEIEVINKP